MPKPVQSGGESARDPVRNSQVEGRYPPFVEPNWEDGSQQDCQKQDDRCGDYQVGLDLIAALRILPWLASG